jgi:hypothetical protein
MSTHTLVLAANPGVVIKHTQTRGRAVYAARAYRAGELVETAPVILGDSDPAKLPDWVANYYYAWNDIGGRNARQAMALGCGSLFSSSMHANLRFRANNEAQAIEYHAVRDIEPGEELTINYSSEHGEPTAAENSWFTERGIHFIEH